LDTKQGLKGTVDTKDTKRKAEALQKWIREQNKRDNKYKFKGGIIVNVSGIWKINYNEEYKVDANYSEWRDLSEII
jgi:hypothetical protein